ncbi:hypothetical protein ACLOJK_006957 [Asimina triloba]
MAMANCKEEVGREFQFLTCEQRRDFHILTFRNCRQVSSASIYPTADDCYLARAPLSTWNVGRTEQAVVCDPFRSSKSPKGRRHSWKLSVEGKCGRDRKPP